MTDFDLTSLFNDWPHEAGKINARKIIGIDGRTKLQIRLDLGLLQMEIDGRPDGLRPEGNDSFLELHKLRLAEYDKHAGTQAGFVLTSEDCRALREEVVQHYHRYVGLFSLSEFSGVVRDTNRNLETFDLCREYGETEFDRTVLEQFRPSVYMMRARSEAELAIAAGQPKDALRAIDKGLNELREFYETVDRMEDYESANEVQLLRGMRDALVPKLPSSQRVELLERLRAAIDAENYELAAILRDELRLLGD